MNTKTKRVMNQFIWLVVVVVGVILFILGMKWLLQFLRETTTKEGLNKSVQLVISRYNEDLEWLKSEPFNEFPNVLIYNKGVNNDFYVPPGANVITVNNVGRCDHTYLYHIIKSYDRLSDITIFLPGSANMDNKYGNAVNLINQIKKNNSAVFANVAMAKESIRKTFADFYLDEWKASDEKNKSINPENALEPSKHRPFGTWYDNYIAYSNPVKAHVYFGIFSVAREDITQNPKRYYEDLIADLSNTSNPEVGHYFERAWVAIFSPLNHTLIL